MANVFSTRMPRLFNPEGESLQLMVLEPLDNHMEMGEVGHPVLLRMQNITQNR